MAEKTFRSDVLIVGGGIAGLTTAIRLKELNPDLDVLIAEKNVTGWGGKANKGYGAFSYFLPEDSPEEFIRYQVSNVGCGLTDQKRALEWATHANYVVEKMVEWGCEFARKENGELDVYKPSSLIPHSRVGAELNITDHLRRKANKMGVRVTNKSMVVRFLKKDGVVNGAVGFDLLNGDYLIFEAKAVVVANGGQNYRTVPMWSSGRGDGIVAAYEAGAEMRNAEFGSFALTVADHRLIYCAEDFMVNGKGEDVTAKYKPELEHFPNAAGTLVVDMVGSVVSGWYKEMISGNGPIYCDTSKFGSWASWKRPMHDRFKALQVKDGAYLAEKKGMGDSKLVEITPINLGELSCVSVDEDYATTVPGLYAIGDASFNGSCVPGATPAPPGRLRGSGLSNAGWSGLRVCEPLLHYVDKIEFSGLEQADVDALKTFVYQPLEREEGTDPHEMLREAQELVTLVKYSGYKQDDRIDEVMGLLAELKKRVLEIKAKDYHYLATAHEIYNIIVCAEIFYAACKERKESRGWFIREDYPHTDNENWLKWVVVTRGEDGAPVTSTEDIPMAEYPVQLTDVYSYTKVEDWY